MVFKEVRILIVLKDREIFREGILGVLLRVKLSMFYVDFIEIV